MGTFYSDLLPGRRDLAPLAVVAVAYAATALAGLQWSVVPGAGTAVWPAAGIAFAAMILGGTRLWPALIVGRMAAALIVESPQPMWADLTIAAGTSLGAVIPALLIRRAGGLDPRLQSFRDILHLVLSGAVLGAVISAGTGFLVLWATGAAPDRAAFAALVWWFGFATGVLTFAPVILTLWSERFRGFNAAAVAHLAACLVAVALVAGLILLQAPSDQWRVWHVFPVLVWAALAFAVRGVALANLIVALIAIFAAVQGLGPLNASDTAAERLLLVQQFVAITTGTMLFLAAVSDERRGKQRLAESERQLRAVFDLAGAGLAQADGEGRLIRVNRRFCEITGFDREELIGRAPSELTHPEDRDRDLAFVQSMRSRPGPQEIEKRYLRKDGAAVWVRVNAAAVRDEEGAYRGSVAVIDDVTERRAAAEALKEESEALALINETGEVIAADLDTDAVVQRVTDAGVALTGAQFGAFFYNSVNEAGEAFVLYRLSGAPREAFEKFGHPRNTAVFAPTFAGEAPVRSDDITADPRYGKSGPHFGMPPGHLPVRSYLAVSVKSRDGRVIGGLFFGHADAGVFTERAEKIVVGIASQAAVALDNAALYQAAQFEIVQRRRAEERQRLLIHELNHRVKNTLATVQSIAGHTLSGAADREEARRVLTDRLVALSRAHDVLTHESWEGAGMSEIARAATAAFTVHGEDRVRCDGPAVRLDPQRALAVAMILHELGTNATKYGALSEKAGVVDVRWREAAGCIELEWSESGGPPVTPPGRRGFGTRLIERLARADLKGTVDLGYAPEGVRCLLRFGAQNDVAAPDESPVGAHA